MAATEQQFIDAYKWLTPEQQTQVYEKVNQQGKTWIDNYNASLNNGWSNQNQGTNLWDWKYWDTSPDRQAQIVNNLNEAYQQDPSRFSDWNTFAQNFNYNYSWRSDTERETMRNWYEYTMNQSQGKDYNDVSNTDYFLSQLINGQTLGWTWAAATAAYNRYKDYQSLSGMTPEQIASAISSNSINPVGQSMIDLKNYSPALYAQVQSILNNKTAVDDINSVGTGIYDGLTKTETNSNYTKYNFTDEYAKNASVIKQYNESLYKKIEWLWWDTAAYVSIVASMLQNPLIQANKDEIENIEWEINKIQDNIWTIADTARERLWSEAPEDLVSAYISQQTKELQTQLRTLNNSLLVAQGKLDNQLTEVDTLIDAINQWIKTYGEDGTSKDKNNYQYVSWTKYQDAGYFDKSTWEFYKLGETPDTHDYESSDPTRLQEIADNLVDIANSDDVYVFRNRSAFNDYFKYSKRSAAQKAVLDEFWDANADKLAEPAKAAYEKYLQRQAAASKWSWGWWAWWGGWWWTDDVSSIKKALMNWTFSWAWTATNLKKYWYKGWADAGTILTKIGQTSTPEEVKAIMWHLDKTDKSQQSALVSWYLSAHKTEIKNALDAITWLSKAKKRKEYATNLLESLWVWATEKNINTILKIGWYGE